MSSIFGDIDINGQGDQKSDSGELTGEGRGGCY